MAAAAVQAPPPPQERFQGVQVPPAAAAVALLHAVYLSPSYFPVHFQPLCPT